MLVGTGRCEEDGGPSDDFISRDNRKSISKTNSKQQEATRNRRGSSSVVEPETRKHQSLSTRQKKKNPLEKDNAVGKESKKLAFNENSKKKNLKSKSESTSTTTSTTTTVQAGNAVGENVMANNNNKKCSTSAGNSSSGSNSVDHSMSSMVTNVMTPDPPILVVNLTQGKILSFTITYLFFFFLNQKNNK